MITREYLEAEIANVTQQQKKFEEERANALANVNASLGALHVLRSLLARLEQEAAAAAEAERPRTAEPEEPAPPLNGKARKTPDAVKEMQAAG